MEHAGDTHWCVGKNFLSLFIFLPKWSAHWKVEDSAEGLAKKLKEGPGGCGWGFVPCHPCHPGHPCHPCHPSRHCRGTQGCRVRPFRQGVHPLQSWSAEARWCEGKTAFWENHGTPRKYGRIYSHWNVGVKFTQDLCAVCRATQCDANCKHDDSMTIPWGLWDFRCEIFSVSKQKKLRSWTCTTFIRHWRRRLKQMLSIP